MPEERPQKIQTQSAFNPGAMERMLQYYDSQIRNLYSEIETLKARVTALEGP